MAYSFDVRIAADMAGPIAAWRDRFVSSVGEAKYRRAAGWAVDEVAKTAVVFIRAQFHKTLKRNSPWTKSAIRYNRSSKEGLNNIEAGKVDDIFASVEVTPKQSTYLKYLFGVGDNTRLPGDVGLAQSQILIPWWGNITLTQGVTPTQYGGVPTGFLARLAREVQGTKAPKRSGTQSRWGVYKGTITIHGQQRLAYIARRPRVASDTESMWIQSGRRGGGMVRVGRRMVNTDHPRVLFLGRRPAPRRWRASPRSWPHSWPTTSPTPLPSGAAPAWQPERRKSGHGTKISPDVRDRGHRMPHSTTTSNSRIPAASAGPDVRFARGQSAAAIAAGDGGVIPLWDEATLSFEFVLASETPCRSYRFSPEGWDVVEVDEVLSMGGIEDVEKLVGAPLFDMHNTYSLKNIIGVIEAARVDGTELVCRARL